MEILLSVFSSYWVLVTEFSNRKQESLLSPHQRACPVPLVPRARSGNWCQSWELRPELWLPGPFLLLVMARSLRGTSLKLHPCSYWALEVFPYMQDLKESPHIYFVLFKCCKVFCGGGTWRKEAQKCTKAVTNFWALKTITYLFTVSPSSSFSVPCRIYFPVLCGKYRLLAVSL